jgi:predicted acyltransferase
MFGASDSLGILQGVVPDNGTLQAFSMSGILVSLYFSRWVAAKKPPIHLILRTISVGVLLIIAGIVARQFWIVSKLAATPSWMFLCTGISIIAYSVLYFAVDIKGKSHWFKIISTAGTATLTCYLVPAIIYPLLTLAKFSYPTMIVAYPQGVIKCILFSLLCIGVTTLLGKIGIKLKI